MKNARLAWTLVAAASLAGCGDDGGSAAASTGPEDAITTAASTEAAEPSSSGAVDSTGNAEASTGSTGSDTEAPEDTLWADRVLNIAHRGGGGTRPEHTLVAYEHARAVGADVLELDVHATADGVLVVMHDDTVDRTTDGEGPIASLTLRELQALDAGYDFSEDGGATFPYRGMGITVPTVEEVFMAHPDVAYVVEIKQGSPSIVDAFLTVSAKWDVLDQMVVGAFAQAILDDVRQAAPEVPTSFSLTEVLAFLALTDETAVGYRPPGQFLQVPPEQLGVQVLDADFIARAAQFELKVHAWTINDEAEMQALIDLGVDGIITDHPARLEALL